MKFTSLLAREANWHLVVNGTRLRAEDLRARLRAARRALGPLEPHLLGRGCLIAVGFSGFDYFLFTLLASALGCRVVLCDPKMLSAALRQYRLDALAVVAPRSIACHGLPVVVLDPALAEAEAPGDDGFAWPRADVPRAQIVFMTSGTTSAPKLVVYDEAQLVENALAVGRYLEVRPGDGVLCMFPTHYMYGFSTIMSGLLAGATVWLERASLTAHEVLGYLGGGRIRFVPLIRSIAERVCDLAEATPGMRFDGIVVLNASDRIYAAQVRRLLALGACLWNNFGQTESGPRIFALPLTPADLPHVASYCFEGVLAPGRPIDPSICLSIVDAQGRPCAPGEPGHLLYRTPYAMQGYLQPDGSLRQFTTLESGDLVFRRDDGVVFWVGRRDETVKCNGRLINVSLLHQHFDAFDDIAKSYFLADPQTGALTVFVVPGRVPAGTEVDFKSRILSRYRAAFPLYPRIADVLFVDDLPVTSTGKISLRLLRESA
ncbi:AMP-dependent synthetase [Burkholderia glumae]|uniref:class I adenylate-forming enzyme family protein n=1 Tax=Burkholderia glumae TaxID=337 RepID=UPI0003A3A527|nr:AMP-binding protein [Burkholderia glumae]MCM2493800.1 AMP-binding protein [Burkholderia glumae]MCM2546991.1 AMP-binding protein [Burkholderia glumae]MCQ0034029.1 AMP-binding protein [Burkholderia glumae]MCQ0037586.1 AMP-binding protein [Burkholderia glumae]PJO21331.1 AMP-dependent synthetase [Burkholderia glumae AU6208]